MNKSVEIKTTLDGSSTLYVPHLDEHYHSMNGALQESLHVFINAGLRHIEKKELSILEIGFGTGLNAYLSLQECILKDKIICYTGIELYPLPKDIINKLNYKNSDIPEDNIKLFHKIHEADWEATREIIPQFHLKKLNKNFTSLNYFKENDKFDVIYYDAFAPDKQADVWNQDIFDYLYTHTQHNGVLVTYCAKGNVRRMMQQSGYSVQRLPGPKGKREMLRAIRP